MARRNSSKTGNRPGTDTWQRDQAAAIREAPDVSRESSPSSNERAKWIWCGVLCAGVFALILSTLITIVKTYTPLPKWDYWSEVMWLRNYYAGSWHVSDLWRQHNEHRLLFPRLFFLSDFFFFSGRGTFLYVSMLALQAANAAIFLSGLRRVPGVGRQVRVGLAAVVLAFFFSGLHLDNFIWTFQVQFILVQLAATVSVWALARYRDDTRVAAYLAASLLAGFVATFSLASGVLVWPVLLVMAIGLRIGPRSILAIGGSGTAAAVMYFSRFQPVAEHSKVFESLRHPVQLMEYVCAYLALPVSMADHGAGALCGAVILAALAWYTCWFLWSRPKLPWLVTTCLGTALFVCLTAFITALGRMSLGPPEGAARYGTPASLLWISLICAAVSEPRWLGKDRSITASLVLTAGTIILTSVILPIHVREIVRVSAAYPIFEDTETAYTTGIVSAAYPMGLVLPDSDHNYPLVDFLRERQLSIFSGSPSPVGNRLTDYYTTVNGSNCRGVWESTAVVPGAVAGAVSVTGWAWDIHAEGPPREVFIVDSAAYIRGMAHMDRRRVDIAEALHRTAAAGAGWFGYARVANTVNYRAFAVLDDGKSACPLKEPEEMPVTRPAVYRRGSWYFGTLRNGNWISEERVPSFGLPDDIPVVGDWDGSGVRRMGVFRQGKWILDWKNSGKAEETRTFSFGLPGDIPVVADWGHTGVSKFGVFRSGKWILDWNGNHEFDSSDRQFVFGIAGDRPVVGDWDGSGTIRVGVFRNGKWLLDIGGKFAPDAEPAVISFGLPGDQPVVGDWTGLGALRLGVFRNGQWYMRASGIEDPTSEESVIPFGIAGDIAIPWPSK